MLITKDRLTAVVSKPAANDLANDFSRITKVSQLWGVRLSAVDYGQVLLIVHDE